MDGSRFGRALLAGVAFAAIAHAAGGVTWGDLGDGRYRNPILKADYSDPDVIRVGDDFYLVASDFHFIGIQVLHSTDLVNWQIVGQVFHRLPIAAKYDEMSAYGEGTWAPAVRYHDGEFYLYVCTPYDGLFMWHTKNPAALWTGPVTVKAVSGWEDPCPFWDDDGQAYLIHSKKGAGPLIVNKMSADGTRLLDEGVTVYTGPTAEGPKLFKRHGYYYISHPEGGVGPGWQAMERARNIYGPYEHKVVLAGSPHQGGMVDLPNGESWFIGFKSSGWLGRICYLEPVAWGSDDWPVFGDHGKPVDVWKKPGVPHASAPSRPPTSDEFTGAELNPIWQWNHNPVDEAWSLTQRKGYLRLTAIAAADLMHARNTITQKLWDDFGTIDVKIDLAGLADGQKAGLTFLSGPAFQWAAAEKDGGACKIVWTDGAGPAMKSCRTVWFRGEYREGQATLAYSFDGKTWTDTGQKITLKFASWKGARFGVFSYGPNAGYADVDYVHYNYRSSAQK
ncbi:MAG TPA: glycoside hydrolase 43 family protein [Bryobacteraceae bacterium]|jgi:beta-xylosidase|nr:glycoside hydrolase 43 family protein [Bryobacteraceae bacterium]